VGEWDVIEQLIKASAVPDLPVHVLGRLYHQLSVACWRQDKLAEAAVHNQAALAMADRCGDQALRADALGSQANLQFWRGEVAPALATWRQALALAPWLTPRQRGALHSNLGAALLETGAVAEGRTELQRALACFEIEGTPMNFSVLHGHLALAALAQGDLADASLHAQCSQAQARSGDYARGLAFAPLLLAVEAARRGQAEAARQGLAASQAAFARLGLDESLNHRLAAEIWRHLGQTEAARQAAHQALARAEGFPLERAAAAAELARVESQALSPPVTGQTVPPPLR
jgi:tetratricopeptide (TPR) repeat protein